VSQFTSPLIIELIGPNLWRTFYSFDYHVGSYPSKEIIVVPTGYVTDFASVPRILWPLLSPVGKYGKAALVHDYCYTIKYKNNRKYCDKIFKEGMEVLKVNPITIFFMYQTVRVFGSKDWGTP
jgi:hypothetical protein